LRGLLFTGLRWARLRHARLEQREIKTEKLAFGLVETPHQILVHPVFEIEKPGAHRRQIELEERHIIERGPGLEIERGAAKAVCHAGADQEGVTEYEGLPASRELDCVFTERVSEEVAGMPADNGIFERC